MRNLKKQKLIILAQSLEDPRIFKRIYEKSEEYQEIIVYGFKRKIHAINNNSQLQSNGNIKLITVGNIDNKVYLARIFKYLKLVLLVNINNSFGEKQIYVFGMDLRFVSVFIYNSKIDYEISDIIWLYFSNIKRYILKEIDFFLARYSRTVVYTSIEYYDKYYRRHVKRENIVISENKFKSYEKVFPIEKIKKDTIRIAYIGAFRYEKIIDQLIKAVEKKENIILNFYGNGSTSVVELIKENAKINKNIFFHGAFKNPDDMEKIYSENNLNFVVYDNNLDNEKVAMPNKFYESGFFNIPIVCAENTYVGKRVLDINMGWTIGIEFDDINSFFSGLKIEDLLKKHNEIKLLDKSLFQC